MKMEMKDHRGEWIVDLPKSHSRNIAMVAGFRRGTKGQRVRRLEAGKVDREGNLQAQAEGREC